MNKAEKLDMIVKVLVAREHDLCPYCFKPLTNYFHGDTVYSGCDNHDESLQIDEDAYIDQIHSIVRFGDFKVPVRHKTLDKFA